MVIEWRARTAVWSLQRVPNMKVEGEEIISQADLFPDEQAIGRNAQERPGHNFDNIRGRG